VLGPRNVAPSRGRAAPIAPSAQPRAENNPSAVGRGDIASRPLRVALGAAADSQRYHLNRKTATSVKCRKRLTSISPMITIIAFSAESHCRPWSG
jgi:hypothetical protein